MVDGGPEDENIYFKGKKLNMTYKYLGVTKSRKGYTRRNRN